jgi:hypothetical protein
MSAPTRNRARPRQESSDLNVRAVVLGAVAVIVTVLLVALVARFLTSASGPARPGATETSVERPRRLPSDPFNPSVAFNADKRAQLESYGWIDRGRGFAHVPIERAMQMRATDDSAKRTP